MRRINLLCKIIASYILKSSPFFFTYMSLKNSSSLLFSPIFFFSFLFPARPIVIPLLLPSPLSLTLKYWMISLKGFRNYTGCEVYTRVIEWCVQALGKWRHLSDTKYVLPGCNVSSVTLHTCNRNLRVGNAVVARDLLNMIKHSSNANKQATKTCRFENKRAASIHTVRLNSLRHLIPPKKKIVKRRSTLVLS
jgi:hypothetical protein